MPATVATRTTPALASALRVSVMRLARRLRNERADNALTGSQLAVLGILQRGSVTVGELALSEGIQPPSMTRIVTALEERGIVAREARTDDRRLVVVRLTEEGERLLAADRKRRDAWLAKRLRELSPEEREIIRRAIPILERLASG